MDPELRSFLEAMEQRTNAKMEAIRTDMAAMEQRAVDRDAETRAALEAKIDEARAENRALHEHTWEKIKAIGEALAADRREETCRIVADRERALMEEHILPLRASAANHEKRMKAVEGR